ncbi:thrombospondin-1-like [Bolinopsis microptera]|uniref:thrombospondin-1-like n=1 Tax=Bolinopsis microptera TaxID=2820187 RepID=UPI003078B034
MIMKISVCIIICLALAADIVADSLDTELNSKEIATEDLKDLLFTSMQSIISLNDLVTGLSKQMAELTILSAQTTAKMEISTTETSIATASLSRELENLKKKISTINDNFTDLESRKKDKGPWKCYHYTESDREWRANHEATHAEMCERVTGGKFTRGKNDLVPDCGTCWCCQDQSALIPVDGGWGFWSDWGECSAECDGGVQTRERSCTDPAPARGGVECRGEGEESRECNSEQCPESPDYTMYIHCDDVLTIFVDGAERRPAGLSNSGTMSTLNIPASSELIAVKCLENGGGYGIIGSVQDAEGGDILVTDSSWKCSNTWESGWSLPGFKEGNTWRAATDLGDGHFMIADHGEDIPSSNMNKRVIWTASSSDTTVYCRKTIK